MRIVSPAGVVRSRVGFIVPRWTVDPVAFGTQGIPFRSMAVAAALVAAGHEVVWFDQEHDLDRADRRAEFREALAGVTVSFVWMSDLAPGTQLGNLLYFARELKSWNPAMRVVTGGGFITLFRPEGLAAGGWPVDFFIRGYGADGAVALLAALESGGESALDDVPGLVHRSGALRSNPIAPRERLRPEHTLLYRALDLSPYVQRGGIFGNEEPTLVVGTGQGCAKGCGFCYWRNHSPSQLDAETVASLVVSLRERYGVRQFHFGELDFFSNRLRPLALARLLAERAPDCRWFALCSPVDAMKLEERDWKPLAAGGCRKLEFGAETGSIALLRAIGKRQTPDDVVLVARRALGVGIQPMVNFVFALVGETAADRAASLDLIERLHALAPGRIHFTFRFFQPAWDTPMGDAAIAAVPGFPASLDDMLAFRHGFGASGTRTLHWIDAEAEALVKKIVFHDLPLATGNRLPTGALRRLAFRALRAIARLRLRLREFDGSFDRALYRKMVGMPLDSTYAE